MITNLVGANRGRIKVQGRVGRRNARRKVALEVTVGGLDDGRT